MLYVVLDCRISSVWINESVSVCCGVNRGGAFLSDGEIRARQAVNMLLLLVLIPKINVICSVAGGHFFCSDVSLITDGTLTTCALIHSFTPVLATVV